jgi:hypothetical protein
VRSRASLSSFFSWCVREKLIVTNPVAGVRVQRQSDETDEMDPFSEAELEEVYLTWQAAAPSLPTFLSSWPGTGLRWADARSLRVADVVEVPDAGPAGPPVTTGGWRGQVDQGQVAAQGPLANRVLPIVLALRAGKAPR